MKGWMDGLLVGKEINFKEDFIQWLPGPGNGNKFLLMKLDAFFKNVHQDI